MHGNTMSPDTKLRIIFNTAEGTSLIPTVQGAIVIIRKLASEIYARDEDEDAEARSRIGSVEDWVRKLDFVGNSLARATDDIVGNLRDAGVPSPFPIGIIRGHYVHSTSDLEARRGKHLASQANRDTDLIALCAALPAAIAEVNASGEDDDLDDSNPVVAAYHKKYDAICATPAQTMAGLVAKCRAAKAEAGEAPDGEARAADDGAASALAWDVVNDLLRLRGNDF